MPKSAQHTIRWSKELASYLLSEPQNSTVHLLTEERGYWLAWLDEHHAFAFHGRSGQLNLLKEKRKRGSEGYWYAYRRSGGRMIKRYIGRDEQLSIERLEEIALLLAKEDDSISPFSNAPAFESLLVPKLQVPHSQKALLPREHLLALLDKGLERKVMLIAGPAGYGKTTLVAQWIAVRSERPDFPRVASVTLDEGDNDPVRFWRYIIAACQQFRAGFGKEALELLLAHRLPAFKPLHMMLIALLNELSQLEQPGILLLDDLHVINSPQLIETLNFFLEHLPTSLHLVMLIRGDPPFSVVRLHARNELLDIYPPQLVFLLEETRAFFEQELAFTLSLRTIKQIHERLEGWPAGMRLFARALRWSDREPEVEQMLLAFAGSYWSIQEYFLREVLHMLPLDQQSFLLQTCILPRVSGELCDAIMDREDSTQLLQVLRGGDLFLIPLDSADEWARYYPLFAEAMQQEARKRLGDVRLTLLTSRASAWYEAHGYLIEAIETALESEDFTRSAYLIKCFIDSKQQANASTVPELYSLHRWLKRLPKEALERNPELYVSYAMTLLFISMDGSTAVDNKGSILRLLQTAEQQWRDAHNNEKLAEIFAFRALLARQEGKILPAMNWARQALAGLPQEERTWRNLALSVIGVGEILEGTLMNARVYLLESLLLNEQLGNHTYARATKGMLSWASVEQGDLRHAAAQYRQMQAQARMQGDRDDIARTQLGLAHIAYQRNNLEEAEQETYEAQEIAEQMNVEELQGLVVVRLAFIEHARGQTALAQQYLTAWLAQRPVPVSSHSYQVQRQVQAALVYMQLANGDLLFAERWFADGERHEEVLPLYQRRRELLLWARLLLARGEIAMAVEHLEGLCADALQTGHTHFAYEIQGVLVRAYVRQGERKKAHEQLYTLLKMTRSEEYLRLYLDEGEEMTKLLRALLPQLHEKALLVYAQRILSNDIHTKRPAELETLSGVVLLERLSPQEEKVLRLLSAGKSNAAIASELVVSVNTIRTQVQSIYRKLNVNNRVEASTTASQLNLL
jgi:ATP/maltotriose-dependent transcriptional regulator MalT